MGTTVANRQIVDQDRFRTGLEKIISGTVDCLNASVWAKEKDGLPVGADNNNH